MRSFGVLFKKEWMENKRKHRMLVLAAVFLLIGITSPLTAKYLPEIVQLILGSVEDMPELGLTVLAPVINDSYLQYYKNLTQMGIFVQILIFMSMVSDEKKKGTAVLVLTKSVSRSLFLLTKYLTAVIVLVISFIPSFLAFYYYTYILFDQALPLSVFAGLGYYLILAVFILTLTFMASTLAKSSALSALISIGGFFSISIFSALPKISDYFPMKLSDAAYKISAGTAIASDFNKSVIITVLSILLMLGISLISFRNQEI